MRTDGGAIRDANGLERSGSGETAVSSSKFKVGLRENLQDTHGFSP
jgi:hypothetical protein